MQAQKKKRLAERKSARKLKTVIKLKYTLEALKSKHQQWGENRLIVEMIDQVNAIRLRGGEKKYRELNIIRKKIMHMQARNQLSHFWISCIPKEKSRISGRKAKINDLVGGNFPVLGRKKKTSEHVNQKDALL